MHIELAFSSSTGSVLVREWLLLPSFLMNAEMRTSDFKELEL